MHHVMNFFASRHQFYSPVCSVLWKEDMNYSVSKRGRSLVSGRAIHANFRRLVIDHMISNGGDILTG